MVLKREGLDIDEALCINAPRIIQDPAKCYSSPVSLIRQIIMMWLVITIANQVWIKYIIILLLSHLVCFISRLCMSLWCSRWLIQIKCPGVPFVALAAHTALTVMGICWNKWQILYDWKYIVIFCICRVAELWILLSEMRQYLNQCFQNFILISWQQTHAYQQCALMHFVR